VRLRTAGSRLDASAKGPADIGSPPKETVSYTLNRSGHSHNGETNLRNKSAVLVAILASMALCAVGSPKLELSWKNPNYTGGMFKNILVLALNGKAANRAEFEDELVAAISRPGGQAAPSYEFMPRPDATPIDMKDLRGLVKEQKFDAIVVARLTKRETKTTYVPGEVYTPSPYYGTFYGYYGAVYPVIYSPGYMQTEKEAQVEVNFYATAKPDGELVWTGTTNTFEASSAMKVIKDLVKIVTKELERENIIERESK
jgi:hypothetical protein